jgi:tetratricopeptide (TPR) repeat protein
MSFRVVALVIILLLSATNINAENNKELENQQLVEMQNIKKKIELISFGIDEVRRDQINYKIEKDLLKEAYSSNLSTVNIIMTILIGVFTVLGFLGLLNVGKIKSDFKEELKELKSIKENYEKKFSEIKTDIEQYRQALDLITTTNDTQNKKIEVLEIQEKTGSLINSSYFERALEYADAGLAIDSNDSILLAHKSRCLALLGRFKEAIIVSTTLNKDEPSNLCNFLELMLISRNLELYDSKFPDWKEKIDSLYPKWIVWYFELLKFYIDSNLKSMTSHITNNLNPNEDKKERKLRGWEFKEVTAAFGKDQETDEKKLLFLSFKFLAGKISEKCLYDQINI